MATRRKKKTNPLSKLFKVLFVVVFFLFTLTIALEAIVQEGGTRNEELRMNCQQMKSEIDSYSMVYNED